MKYISPISDWIFRFAWLQAGKLLAQVLMQGGHGDRPVTLAGYSMGARLIFHCLLELARHDCKGGSPYLQYLACWLHSHAGVWKVR